MTASGVPSTRVAITGTAAAIASRTTIGKPSPYRLGSTIASNFASAAGTSSVKPTCSTRSRISSASICNWMSASYDFVSNGPITRRQTFRSRRCSIASASSATSNPLRGRINATIPIVQREPSIGIADRDGRMPGTPLWTTVILRSSAPCVMQSKRRLSETVIRCAQLRSDCRSIHALTLLTIIRGESRAAGEWT